MKKIIKSILKDTRLFYIIKYQYIRKPNYPSVQHFLQLYSRHHNHNVQFIQVGANDGKSNDGDQIYPFVKMFKWKGILIEPVPYLYNSLINNYSRIKNLSFENVAIANKPGITTFYYFNDPSGWYNQLGSFNKVHLENHKKSNNIPLDINEIEVKCETINNIVKRNNLNHIDILHIDTEGYDFQIIKSINFELVKPNVIIYENRHLSENENKTCELLLKQHNFSIYRLQFDTIAYQPISVQGTY